MLVSLRESVLKLDVNRPSLEVFLPDTIDQADTDINFQSIEKYHLKSLCKE